MKSIRMIQIPICNSCKNQKANIDFDQSDFPRKIVYFKDYCNQKPLCKDCFGGEVEFMRVNDI